MKYHQIRVGEDVLVRVDRIYQTSDKAEVTVVSSSFPSYPIRGSIRLQDVRSFDIDKATICDHFMPGDILKAKTIALGDVKSTFFSTIGAEYGVVLAKNSMDGEFLVPVDQSHMRSEDGQIVVKRKVAKPTWLTIPPPETALDN